MKKSKRRGKPTRNPSNHWVPEIWGPFPNDESLPVLEIVGRDSIHTPREVRECFPAQWSGWEGAWGSAVGKKDLMKWIKKVLDPEKNLDLDFLLKLEVKELEILLAALRERMER